MKLSNDCPVIAMKASAPAGSSTGAHAQVPTSATDSVADGVLRAMSINATDLPAAGTYPRSTYWADLVIEVLQFDTSSPQSPRAQSLDEPSPAAALSTPGVGSVSVQSRTASVALPRELSGPSFFATGAGDKAHVQNAQGTDDDPSRWLRQCVDGGEGVAESRTQLLKSLGPDRARTNPADNPDVSLYRKFNEFFHTTDLSREDRLTLIFQIRQLLKSGACLPEENRGDCVLNGEMFNAIRRANSGLVELLWTAGTGGGGHAFYELNRDQALIVLFEGEADLNRQLETATRLIRLGCPVDGQMKDGSTALIVSAAIGNVDAIELLLDAGAAVNVADGNGQTALIWASKCGHVNVVEELLASEARVDQKDQEGRTASMLAAIAGHAPVLKVLLAHGASLDERDQFGQTPLMFATAFEHAGVVKFLLDNGAGVDRTYPGSHPALSLAAALGQVSIVKLLLDKGANVNFRVFGGHTALTLAVARGDVPTVTLILNAGADVHVRIADGRNALALARALGHADVAALLVRRGAVVRR
jgi:ankyrin repeat protein